MVQQRIINDPSTLHVNDYANVQQEPEFQPVGVVFRSYP